MPDLEDKRMYAMRLQGLDDKTPGDVMVDRKLQSWNLRFSFFPNRLVLTIGRASVSKSFSRSSRVLLISTFPPVPTTDTPPELENVSGNDSLASISLE